MHQDVSMMLLLAAVCAVAVEASEYLDVIRDWAANGDRSVFAILH